MPTFRMDQVVKIRAEWKGNGGTKSLYEITKSYGLTVNEAYSLLSAVEFEAMRRAKSRYGWKIHSYREVA